MGFIIGCTLLEKLSIGNFVLSVVSLIIACVAIRTSKRYASGNIRIVDEALSDERLEKGATILSEETPGEGNVGLKLYLSDANKYCALMMIFQELNNAALLVLDGSLPKNVCDGARACIARYLLRKQVLDFVSTNKDTFGGLYEIAKSGWREA